MENQGRSQGGGGGKWLKHPLGSGDCPRQILKFEIFPLALEMLKFEMGTPFGPVLAKPLRMESFGAPLFH